ncbi:putative odorant receptor 83c [Drosophila innubila]|uniref:putative odorant receptor 83c n=1 Tax=Drosophila innubila TaxID=198719 RepID=UPI00148D5AF1|nr:putative odorant receptor 83c [Drosophila innubila]
MKPSQRYQKLTKNMNYCMKLIGFDILNSRLKFNYRTWITVIAVTCYGIFSVHWMIRQAEISWTECLKASIMMGGMLNGSTEIVTIVLRQPEIRRLMINTRQLFENYEQRNAAYCKALNLGIDRLLDILKMIRFGYIVSYLVMCLVPLILLIYNGTRVTIVQYELPGVPLDNNYGYAFTYLSHLVSMFIAGVGFYAGDLMGCLALMQILTYSDILQVKADELNAALDQKVEKRRTAVVGATIDGDGDGYGEPQMRLLESIKWHQWLTEYCHNVDHIYHILIAGQVMSSAISMLCTFCVSISEFHLISVIYFVVSGYKMLVYCVVGTKIEYAVSSAPQTMRQPKTNSISFLSTPRQYDQVYESICSISWHELNGSQRNMFRMMLKEAQNSQTIMMLGMLPLSVRTALQITKLIYSVSMMMMQNRT